MSAEAAVQARVGRSYTQARRYPWVLGRIGDWTVPFGPYTPAQIVVAVVGAFVLIKTFSWWSFLGPVPVVVWAVAIWAVRGVQIGGRSPFNAAAGLVELALQPSRGRIHGRAVRESRSRVLYGGFALEEVEEAGEGTPLRAPKAHAGGVPGPAPTTLQSLLRQGPGRRGW
ncbi:hypothetical protein [Streptomyces luteireticuli]|uniref:hypothetical protein n=1 Tax=Streptomyces luteireticuli TaxID=173858 RepID=UPI003555DB34